MFRRQRADELQAEFDGKYPYNLINDLAREMEVDEGPWGVEDYGDTSDEPESERAAAIMP